MASSPFRSQAPNREDVVLWRALGDVADGRAIEIGEAAEGEPVVLRSLRELGWHITVLRARDAADATERWAGQQLHVLAGGDAAATGATLAALGAAGVRPWVVVAAVGSRTGAADNLERSSTEAGYRLCLYDGVNAIFVHDDHAELRGALGYPACIRDDYTTPEVRALAAERDALAAELSEATASAARWRRAAIDGWGEIVADPAHAARFREAELMRRSLSWRVTRPLRAVRTRLGATDEV